MTAATSWSPANAAVAAVAAEPPISEVLASVSQMDRALVENDPGAFVALLAADLVVNNPQDTVSEPGVTAAVHAAGRISYTAYHRIVEFAGLREPFIVLMGLEVVVPKPPHPRAGEELHRRFTDLWRKDDGTWRLAIRQATVVAPQPAAATEAATDQPARSVHSRQ